MTSRYLSRQPRRDHREDQVLADDPDRGILRCLVDLAQRKERIDDFLCCADDELHKLGAALEAAVADHTYDTFEVARHLGISIELVLKLAEEETERRDEGRPPLFPGLDGFLLNGSWRFPRREIDTLTDHE